MARAIETHGETLVLLLSTDEVDALTQYLNRDPQTLPGALRSLHDLLTWEPDEDGDR